MASTIDSLKRETHRPLNDDPGHWIAYWRAQGQSWRTEPEIGDERQRYLFGCIKAGATPASEDRYLVNVRLHRSDIEWLLWLWHNRSTYDSQIDSGEIRAKFLGFCSTAVETLNLSGTGSEIIEQVRETIRSESQRSKGVDDGKFDIMNSEPERQHTTGKEVDGVDDEYVEVSPTMTPEVETLLRRYASGERYFVGLNLVRATLHGVNLRGADLAKCDLTAADLSYSDLSYSNLGGARLCAANLSYAKLVHTKLKLADLSSADLSFAVIESANTSGANLQGANLQGTSLYKEQQVRHEYAPDTPYNRVRASNVISSFDYMGDWWSQDPEDR